MEIVTKYKQTRARLFEAAGIDPKSLFVDTQGPVKKVHYLQIGSGEPLIMIHGGLSHSSEWINILKPLSENFTLYVLDRPGHGLTDPINYRSVDYRASAVEFIRSFMDTLALERAHLLGCSMGGYFSICFAIEEPVRVKKLALIGAPAGMNLWIPFPLRILGTSGLNRLLLSTLAKPSISGARKIHKQLLVCDADKLSDDYYEHTYLNQLLPGAILSHTSMLESALTIRGWKKELYLGNRLEQLDVPTHFIWGDNDAFEKPKTGLEKAKVISNHTFKVVHEAGHLPWLDRPDECVEAIIEALA